MPVAKKLLPRIEDGLSFLYVEHARIEQEDQAIVLYDQDGRVPVPAASLATLLLGPGTAITHAAMRTLADGGCSVVWCGEDLVRFYAAALPETFRAGNLLHQAATWADPTLHHQVVLRMYRMRFDDHPDPNLSLAQLRGLEGVRVRDTYARLSRETGVRWTGRNYKHGEWSSADPVNRALSAANACLYGLCHAAIVSAGFSPTLGFIHTGKILAFVYDIADLYKCETTMPAAFAAVQQSGAPERTVRALVREAFNQHHLLQRLVPDVQRALGMRADGAESLQPDDGAAAAALWNRDGTSAPGGMNYGAEDIDAGEDA